MSDVHSDGSFVGHHFDWSVERTDKPYRVVVVEPPFLAPPTHAAIFNAAISHLLSPTVSPVSALKSNAATVEEFDLVTFPEAFLPAQSLVDAIKLLAAVGAGRFGCIHVGLRPSEDDNHLFSVAALEVLMEGLTAITEVSVDDLEKFSGWLQEQETDSHFNVACLFTVDTEARIRVCLHPKTVRSKYEVSAFTEADMTEANVLSLVTLVPSDPNMLSITMQPLICSDALHLDTDKPGHLPILAVNAQAGTFANRIPDYVDVVSVATCTPQSETTAPSSKSRSWHQHFRETFRRAGEDPGYQRHAYAAFVVSNFWLLGPKEPGSPGGLSGAFLPIKLAKGSRPQFMQVSSYGMGDGEAENNWSVPSPAVDPDRRTRGYIAQLTPYGADLPAPRMLSFTIHRLPRHAQPWGSTPGLRRIQLRTGKKAQGGAWTFEEVENADSQ